MVHSDEYECSSSPSGHINGHLYVGHSKDSINSEHNLSQPQQLLSYWTLIKV